MKLAGTNFLRTLFLGGILSSAIVLQFNGCDSSTTGPDIYGGLPHRYFKDSVQAIFDMHCTGCHQSGGFGWGLTGADTAVGLDLVNAYATTVNKPSFEREYSASVPKFRVKPGFPDSSYLYQKVNDASPAYGDRMPLESGALSDEELAIIRKWILNGAPLGDTVTLAH